MSKEYVAQYPVQSMSGALDKHGDPQVYTVGRAADGHYECSCMAWMIYGRGQHPRLHDGIRYSLAELETYGYTPNRCCKHIMLVLNNQHRLSTAVASRGSVRVQTGDLYIEVQDGRILGFLEKLGVK